jgi:NAD(P)-dependent dehydrogenase (short-subunit alcohol dehydrogenase family)
MIGAVNTDRSTSSQMSPDLELARRVDAAIELLESIRDDRGQLAAIDDARRTRLLQAAGHVARPDPWAKRELLRAAKRRRQAERRANDERVLERTGIRELRREPVFVTPLLHAVAPLPPGADLDRALAAADPAAGERAAAGRGGGARERTLIEPRTCYVCKRRYRELHAFYDSLCTACGDLNFAKRSQSADLAGRVALITGARVKIGYQAAIMLLRAGAHVIVTTRFPRDAAARYAREPDWEAWGDRLQVYGLDLRHTPSVEAFTRHLPCTLDRLDFILNNACQTVRRPAGFYQHLMTAERQATSALPERAQRALEGYEAMRAGARALLAGGSGAGTRERAALEPGAVGLHDPAALSQIALLDEDREQGAHIFPEGQLDADLQQIDLRAHNSWRLSLSEVPAVELLEVQLVNAVAPFVLNARLKPLMTKVPSADKHIVNVSAMEGQFYRRFKTDKHPHTNMAKAALNMMTRTSAADYVKDGIHMNSVDTGWVTDEDAAEIAARKTREQGFHPPLDIVDGAARICDPIFAGVASGKHVWGLFLKDYAPTDW